MKPSHYLTPLLAATLAVGLGTAGCNSNRTLLGKQKTTPLPAEAFFARPATATQPAEEARRPVPDPPSDDLGTIEKQREAQRQANLAQSATTKATHATATAQQRPAAPQTTGQYMTLGGVIAEVNGTPIYANRVLRNISAALAANARIMDRQQYNLAAMQLITDQVKYLVRDEVTYAAALKNLDQADKSFADMLTTKWRSQQVTEFGGSVETARRNAPEIARRANLPEDMTLEELSQEKHREYIIRIWVERKIKPRVQITQPDMRAYYERNLDKQFTQHAQARFRVIFISPAASGSRDAAVAKIQQIKQRLDNGEDFETLAKQFNDNKAYMASGGDVGGWIARDAFALEKLEKAVWDTPAGKVTPVVEDRGGFYLAEVTAKKEGRTRPFSDQQVQDEIRRAIEGSQTATIRERYTTQLMASANVRSDPAMAQTALEMAMQAYPRLAAAATQPTAEAR